MNECSITPHPSVVLLVVSFEHLSFFLDKRLLPPKVRCSTAASPALDAEFEMLLGHLMITVISF